MKLIQLTSHITTWNFNGQRVIVRADLNIPLDGKKIISDYRLQQLKPTLDTIIRKRGKIILMTHIGRPEEYSADLSTQLLIPWFEKEDYKIQFVPDLNQAYDETFEKPDHILLLDNLRFYPGEEEKDSSFVQSLAQLGDFYVNDAFGTSHRHDSSIALLPYEFKKSHRTIGLLVEHELKQLNKMLEYPQKPFVAILAGGKLADKIPIIDSLLDVVQVLLLGPAIVSTFLHSLGKSVGLSLIDSSLENECRKLLKKAQEKNIRIVFPHDYQVALHDINGPLAIAEADTIPSNAVAMSIGPKTIHEWTGIIQKAGMVFQNGLMGFANKPETLEGILAILRAMSASSAFSLVGGGDSVAIAIENNFQNSLSALSTGGGATLAYIAGKELPGLKPYQ